MEGIESFRRLPFAREYLLADIGEPLAYCRVGERITDRGVKFQHDRDAVVGVIQARTNPHWPRANESTP